MPMSEEHPLEAIHEYSGGENSNRGTRTRIKRSAFRTEKKFTAEALTVLYTGKAVYADPTRIRPRTTAGPRADGFAIPFGATRLIL